MIKVVIFSGAYDTGGQGYRIKRAFDRYQPNFSVRAVHTLEGYFNYPRDLRKGATEVKDLLANADIIHMVNGIEGLEQLRPTAVKGVVVHHRGTKFREYHKRLSQEAEQAGAVQVASTIDLILLEPNVSWLPSPYEVDELNRLREEWKVGRLFEAEVKPEPIRIAHAPTNRVVKSTQAVMDAILELNRRGIPSVLDLIERQPWNEVLIRKAKADIYVDQLHLGYGNNAIEAWAMGLPVVAGVSDVVVRDAMIRTWASAPPFYEATEATLADTLAKLATDPVLRHRWGELGRDHVTRWHSAETVSYRLASIYEAALRKGQPLTEPEREVSNG